jgi:hypothetical protein
MILSNRNRATVLSDTDRSWWRTHGAPARSVHLQHFNPKIDRTAKDLRVASEIANSGWNALWRAFRARRAPICSLCLVGFLFVVAKILPFPSSPVSKVAGCTIAIWAVHLTSPAPKESLVSVCKDAATSARAGPTQLTVRRQ